VNEVGCGCRLAGQNVQWKLKDIWCRQIHSFYWSLWVSYRRDEKLLFQWNVVHITVEVWCGWGTFQLPVCWSKCSLKIDIYMMQTNPFLSLVNLSVLSAWWEPLVSVECCLYNSWSLVWMEHVSVAVLLVKMLTENWNINDPDRSILVTGQFECHTGMMRSSIMGKIMHFK